MKRLASFTFIGVAITACSIGETNYEKITLPVREAKETRTCESPAVAVDVSKLVACGNGKGHCYPASKTAFPATEFEACAKTGDICLPDQLLTANGKPFKSCDWVPGQKKPGACLPTMIKQVGENAKALQKDVCDEDERCAPCIDPRDGSNSHACDPQGVYEKDCEGGAGDEGNVESCCHGSGLCLDELAVPEDNRGDMSREVCSEGKLCAPAAMADGKPTKCDVLGVSGVCLDVCFAAMLKGAQKPLRGGCGPTELCLPCVIGSGQGMPGCD